MTNSSDAQKRTARSAFAGNIGTAASRWATSFHAVLLAVLSAGTCYMVRPFVIDPDLWWHLKTGELILRTRHLPLVDSFSYTAQGMPWISTEWLGEIGLFYFYSQFGLRGLASLLFLGSIAVVALLYGLASIRSGSTKAAFVAVALLLGSANGTFNLRPQMVGFAFLVATLICLELFRRGRHAAVWLLPPLFLIWVNTHGSWIVGLAVIVVHLCCGLVDLSIGRITTSKWTAKNRQRLELTVLLCLIAVTITPYGTELARYPFGYSSSSLPVAMSIIVEWQPMRFDTFPAQVFLAVVMVFFLIQMSLPLRWRLDETLLFFGGLVLSFRHVRFLMVFVPLFTPMLATAFASWIPPYADGSERRAFNAMLIATAVVGAVVSLPSADWLAKRVAEQFPVSAVRYIQTHNVPTPMFNDYGYGGYLVWSDERVFVDGRADLFENVGVLGDYAKASYARHGALKILQNYNIQSCLLVRDGQLAALLRLRSDWEQVFSDNTTALFVRSQAPALPRFF